MFRAVSVAIALALTGSTAMAELQNLEVGGSIQIYGNYYTDFFENRDDTRIGAAGLFGRPVGSFARDPLSQALVLIIRTDNSGTAEGLSWVEQRTALHIRADFTDSVSTFIELDSINDWGTDFRANYVTGLDGPGAGEIDLYQAYIEVRELGGLPLRLRLGRQELILGNEWLVGNNSLFDPFSYLSFDGARLTYGADKFSVDAFWMKLNENFASFGDGDAELYGLYGSYTGLEDFELNLYWLLVRDGVDIEDVAGLGITERFEDWLGVDNYDTTTIHTVGLRAAGTVARFDVEAEIAYQFGDASTAGAAFAPFTYGDDSASYGEWAGQFSIGYGFETKWSPYVYFGGEYYGGEDNRDQSILEFLNPFDRPDASISFNRLFSSWESENFLDAGNLSNIWLLKAGISAEPTEKIEVGLDLIYFETVDSFRSPVLGRFGARRIPILTPFPWGGKESDSTLGYETTLWFSYAYSADLSFEAGWAHFFTGDGLEDGNFVDQNGFGFFGGLDNDDAEYFYAGTTISF
jgi:hypothetical protein